MTRLLAGAALLLCLAGCTPATLVLVGAGLGYAASVNNLAIEIIKTQPAREGP
jgi:hypothetical protein